MSSLSFIQHESEPSIRPGKTSRPAPAPLSTTIVPAPIPSTPSPPNPSIPSPPALPPVAEPEPSPPSELQRPKLRTAVIMSSLCASVFVAAVDITMISPAVPSIAADFHSSSGYQWVASAYVLGSTASTPSWGAISDIWGWKSILLFALVVFFTGSLICALGGSMAAFLAGRAVQGVGASGLLTLVTVAIGDLFSLRERGFYYGLTSVVWAVASGVGPVLGGVFAQKLTFRWCFWINLPISAAVFIFLYFTMPHDNPGTPVLAGLKAIDWTGSLLIVGGTLMLLLGLNFGGVTFSWSSATVINLLTFGLFAVFLFGLNEWKLVRYPVIPMRLFRKRSNVASLAVCFFQGFVMMGVAYYLPLYFQAVLGSGALLSGVYLLPFILANMFLSAGTGIYIQKTGKYIAAVYIGLVLMTLGTGLLINLDVETNWKKIIIYQILVGAGVGMIFEGPLLALQAGVDAKDVATTTATMGFTRELSTAVSAVIGGVVFQNQMLKEASILAGLGPAIAAQLQGGGATVNIDLIKTLPSDQQVIARGAFSRSLRTMWIMYVVFAALSSFAGLFIAVHSLSKEHETIQIGLVENRTVTDVNVRESDGHERRAEVT